METVSKSSFAPGVVNKRTTQEKSILTVNGGSSSIKIGLYRVNPKQSLAVILRGSMNISNTQEQTFQFENKITGLQGHFELSGSGVDEFVSSLIRALEKQAGYITADAIGHRIVFGLHHKAPEKITPALMTELRSIAAYDPEHLPVELKWIEGFLKQFPTATQIACYDTLFHDTMPLVAKRIALPRRFYDKGIQRYGFHGLSYTYLLGALRQEFGEDVARGKIIMAHLGNGASVAAINNGKSIDTSMGFTPTSGIPMSTRTGDIDPGVAWYLMQMENLDPKQFNHLVNHESGLLGISETSADMRELLKAQVDDTRAAEAIEFFCYHVKKQIGAFAAVLEGVETLIFTGGIGEKAPEIRRRICQGLQFLGIELDEKRNEGNEMIISCRTSTVKVHVMATDEQRTIAELVCQVMYES